MRKRGKIARDIFTLANILGVVHRVPCHTGNSSVVQIVGMGWAPWSCFDLLRSAKLRRRGGCRPLHRQTSAATLYATRRVRGLRVLQSAAAVGSRFRARPDPVCVVCRRPVCEGTRSRRSAMCVTGCLFCGRHFPVEEWQLPVPGGGVRGGVSCGLLRRGGGVRGVQARVAPALSLIHI